MMPDSDAQFLPPGSDDSATSFRSLVRSRRLLQRFMDDWWKRQGSVWHETTVTDLLCVTASSRMRYIDFNQREEVYSGADLLVWVIDDVTGEAFGALMQAKSLKKRGRTWKIDFFYKGGDQMDALKLAASVLSVPAVYLVYCGGPRYLEDFICPAVDRPDECRSKSVVVVPALEAESSTHTADRALGLSDTTAEALHYAVPIETLFHDISGEPRRVVPFGEFGEVQVFLNSPQVGVRRIAKRITQVLTTHAQRSFRLLERSAVDLDGAPFVFDRLPADQGHFTEPFLPFVLRGLRVRPPDYVQTALDGGSVPDEVQAHARAMVVVWV